jgi:hypothetical protein
MFPTPKATEHKGGYSSKSGSPSLGAMATHNLWATPNTMDHLPQRSPEALKRQATTTRKGRTRPANLREQVDPETVNMWRTPDAHCDRGASSEERMKMKLEKGMPISINDQVAHPDIMWPTPNASDHRDRGNLADPAIQRRIKLGKQVGLTMAVKEKKGKGSLNPEWVEWLMGFPQNWTDLDKPSEPEHRGFPDEPNIPRVEKGVQDRVNRLKCLGNAVVPQIITNIALSILETSNELDGSFKRSLKEADNG